MSFLTGILEEASQTATESVIPETKHIENLPQGSIISVICCHAEWKLSEKHPDRISVQWEVTAPAALKGRKAFQTIKLNENENAARMFTGLYYQALKKPYPYGRELPNDSTLAHDLLMCKANLGVREWQIEDEIDDRTDLPPTGNWFDSLAVYNEQETKVGTLKFSKNKPKPSNPQQQTQGMQQAQGMSTFDKFDDSVPF